MTRYDLTGRTVVVTGGTGGFARALAPALHARGAKVALLDLDGEQAAAAAAAVGPPDVSLGLRADVCDLAGLETAMQRVAETFGRVDVVVANAGLGETSALLAEDDPAVWERTVDVNLNGVYRTFRAASPHVVKTRGYLLATSSMAAFVHAPLQGAYTATKAGVWALCDSWRLEVRHLGVAVGSLHPTFFRTPMTDRVQASPAGHRLWDGNSRGIWKMIDIDVVVSRTVRGIERRAAHIVAPGALRLPALAPGVMQAVVERIGFRGNAIEEAIALLPKVRG